MALYQNKDLLHSKDNCQQNQNKAKQMGDICQQMFQKTG